MSEMGHHRHTLCWDGTAASGYRSGPIAPARWMAPPGPISAGQRQRRSDTGCQIKS